MVDIPKVNVGEAVGLARSFTERALSTPSTILNSGRDVVESIVEATSFAEQLAQTGPDEFMPRLDEKFDDDFTVDFFGEPVTISQIFVRLCVRGVCEQVALTMRSNKPRQ